MVAEGAALVVNIANGPGNTTDWVGLAAAGTPDTAFIAWAYLNGTQTPPAVGVTSATVMMTAPTTDGPYEARFYPNNALTVSARTSFAVMGVAPPPPPPVSPDGTTSTAPSGPALNTGAGTWTWSFAAVGRPGEYNVNLNGAAAGVGVLMEVANGGQLYVNTAHGGWYLWNNNGFVASAGPVTPPPPPPAPPPAAVITVTPNTPQVPDTTSVGAVVATYTVTMSDGSPFVGTIGFGPPNFDAGRIFALMGSPTSGNIIVNPSGPGVGPNLGTITDHITLMATQP